MNSSGAPITHRLILGVLSLILVCLVLLVVRAYRPPDQPEPLPPGAVVVDDSPKVESIQSRPPKPITFTPRRVAPDESAAVPTPTAPPVEVNAKVPTPSTSIVAAFPPPLYTPGGSSPNAGRASIAGGSGGGSSSSQPTASIVGTVTLQGTPPPEVPIALGPSCGRLNPNPVTTRHYVVGSPVDDKRALANVLVYVSAGVSQKYSPTHGTLRLDQIGCMYEPYVFAVLTGEKFLVRNSDPEMHNVHITPRLNKERNFSQPAKGQVNTIAFDKPELFVRIKCDVHPWMFAYASVIDHPFFNVSDTNGVFVLPSGLPAGTYTVTAVHLKAGFLNQKITLSSGESKVLNFQFLVPDPTQAGNIRVRNPVGDEP